jgi:hypothetical protein
MLTRFKHSGHSGDIIYSLALVHAYWKLTGVKSSYQIKLNVESQTKGHSMGKYMISRAAFDFLKPLLLAQPYISEVVPYKEGDHIDYDLDVFREKPINLSSGHIALWNCLEYPELTPDLSQPWLYINSGAKYGKIMARSMRYTNPMISYAGIGGASFIGLENEYKWACQYLNAQLSHLKINDALAMAQVIAGCDVFVGNQSFPFAIAEGLKVTRILESYQGAPNVIPIGGKAYQFYDQKSFDKSIILLTL